MQSVFPFLSSARVATAPLHAAGGTRIKILEALSSGVPVVATSLGALGLEALPNDVLTIVDDAESFAEAIIASAYRPVSVADRCRDSVSAYRWEETMKLFARRVTEVGACDG